MNPEFQEIIEQCDVDPELARAVLWCVKSLRKLEKLGLVTSCKFEFLDSVETEIQNLPDDFVPTDEAITCATCAIAQKSSITEMIALLCTWRDNPKGISDYAADRKKAKDNSWLN